jgi:hypothetical protein
MNEQQRAAMKLALAFLQQNQQYIVDNERHAYVMLYNDFVNKLEDIISQDIISQDAPPKQDVPETNFGNMAEPKIGCVNHDCDKCKAVQEPAPQTWEWTTPATALSGGSGSGIVEVEWFKRPAPVQEPVAVVSGYYGGQCVVLPINPARLFNSGTAFYTAPQPVPVKTYHDGKPWPVQPKPWMGLTKEDKEDFWTADQMTNEEWEQLFAKIETKLKEKNHDQ